MFLGRPFNVGDLGVGVFADAGRLWAGDIPYGVNTPIRSAIGFSLLGDRARRVGADVAVGSRVRGQSRAVTGITSSCGSETRTRRRSSSPSRRTFKPRASERFRRACSGGRGRGGSESPRYRTTNGSNANWTNQRKGANRISIES